MKSLEKNINYEFKDKKLLIDAISHSSIKKFSIPFERLEFLGDRILGVVVAEYIFKKFKDNEGSMAKMHSAFVCANACHQIAISIGLDKVLKTAGDHLKTNKTVLADAMESLIGAIFIDSSYENVQNVILALWHDLFTNYDASNQEPKTQLQEIVQAKTGETPVYELISVTGPDHMPIFSVSVTGLEKKVTAVGNSKKIAETNAAKILLAELKKS